jgi:hypothetical protein
MEKSPAHHDPDQPVEVVKDGGARHWAAIDADLAAGRIDEAEWYRRCQAILVPHYLAGANPRAQSGHSGDPRRWEGARRPILAAVDADGTFLDVGCANGHLMECLREWAAQDGCALEPYGLDISPELVDLARRRLPHWTDRIWVGNALTWTPPHRFDYVRTSLDYVPRPRRGEYIAHLLGFCRRLIVGMDNEDRRVREAEEELVAMGYRAAGRVGMGHLDPRLARRACWIDS